MQSDPIVDRVAADFRGKVRVVKVDIHTPPGRLLWDRFGVRFTPTFVFLDAAGQETHRRTGVPGAEELQADLARLVGTE